MYVCACLILNFDKNIKILNFVQQMLSYFELVLLALIQIMMKLT